jgi:hypothetical protein
MGNTRDMTRFHGWLDQHAKRYYARHERWRSLLERPAISPLEDRKGWAEAVLANAKHPNSLTGDLARMAPKKHERITQQRLAIRAIAKDYLRAWDEVAAAFADGQTELTISLLLVDLAIRAERIIERFVAVPIEPDKVVTIWECVHEGAERFRALRELPRSGAMAHRDKGSGLQSTIEAARSTLVAKDPVLGGPRMRSELARRIKGLQLPELMNDDGTPRLDEPAIRKRLQRISHVGTPK